MLKQNRACKNCVSPHVSAQGVPGTCLPRALCSAFYKPSVTREFRQAHATGSEVSNAEQQHGAATSKHHGLQGGAAVTASSLLAAAAVLLAAADMVPIAMAHSGMHEHTTTATSTTTLESSLYECNPLTGDERLTHYGDLGGFHHR